MYAPAPPPPLPQAYQAQFQVEDAAAPRTLGTETIFNAHTHFNKPVWHEEFDDEGEAALLEELSSQSQGAW